jgi:LysM repeat protein
MGSVRRGSWNQYLIYLLINVVVSAITVLVVLSIWDRRDQGEPATATATVDVIALVESAIPTATRTAAPTLTPVTYMIRSGDTLTDIAIEFNVSVDAIMDANDITDPNSLSAGDVLIIPISESGGPVAPPPTSGIQRSTQTPQPEGAVSVIINAVESAGDLSTESVRLLNTGGVVSMAGWVLDDGENHLYTFPDFTFYTTGAVDVHTRIGNDTSIDLYWGLNEPIWTPGKVITLRDADGIVQSTFLIPES